MKMVRDNIIARSSILSYPTCIPLDASHTVYVVLSRIKKIAGLAWRRRTKQGPGLGLKRRQKKKELRTVQCGIKRGIFGDF